jgi:hypothetical protein
MAKSYPVPAGRETMIGANGHLYYKTEGGNWRDTVTGKAEKNPAPQAAATPAAGPAPGIPANPTEPAAPAGTYDPQRQTDLESARANLADQVGKGWITQEQADAELNRMNGLSSEDIAKQVGRTTQPVTGASVDNQGTPATPPINASNANQAIATQLAANDRNLAQQQGANRYNQSNPYGSSEWEIDPATGMLTRKESLSAPQQQILDNQQQQDIGVGQTSLNQLGQFNAKGEYNYANAPKIPGSEDLQAERKRQEDMVNQNFSARNEPRFAQEQEALKQSLADRGIPLTSERAKMELSNLNQTQNDARLNSQVQGISTSGTEYDRSFSTGLTNRQQYINEYDTQYTKPLNTMAQLGQLQKGVVNPNYQAASDLQVGQVDVGKIGADYGNIDAGKYVADNRNKTDLEIAREDAEARRDVANINKGAAIEAAKIGSSSSESEGLDLGATVETGSNNSGDGQTNRTMNAQTPTSNVRIGSPTNKLPPQSTQNTMQTQVMPGQIPKLNRTPQQPGEQMSYAGGSSTFNESGGVAPRPNVAQMVGKAAMSAPNPGTGKTGTTKSNVGTNRSYFGQ